MHNYKIGILAFGSLISDPGEEIKSLEIDRIECLTPFKVEFARISTSRNNAPTLIPVEDSDTAKNVKAYIIVLNNEVSLEQAKSILWRRECHKENSAETYEEPINPTPKKVLVKEKENFEGVEKVLYTAFKVQERYGELNPDRLAEFAIESILSEAGEKEKDGIRYLLSVEKYGIQTELSQEYKKQILIKSGTKSLEEAIIKFDLKREEKINKNEN